MEGEAEREADRQIKIDREKNNRDGGRQTGREKLINRDRFKNMAKEKIKEY